MGQPETNVAYGSVGIDGVGGSGGGGGGGGVPPAPAPAAVRAAPGVGPRERSLVSAIRRLELVTPLSRMADTLDQLMVAVVQGRRRLEERSNRLGGGTRDLRAAMSRDATPQKLGILQVPPSKKLPDFMTPNTTARPKLLR